MSSKCDGLHGHPLLHAAISAKGYHFVVEDDVVLSTEKRKSAKRTDAVSERRLRAALIPCERGANPANPPFSLPATLHKRTFVLYLAAAIFCDTAYPTAFAIPWPRGPVVASTPGVSANSGCPATGVKGGEPQSPARCFSNDPTISLCSTQTWRIAAHGSEVFDLVQGNLGITTDVQPTVNKHGSVPRTKNEPGVVL